MIVMMITSTGSLWSSVVHESTHEHSRAFTSMSRGMGPPARSWNPRLSSLSDGLQREGQQLIGDAATSSNNDGGTLFKEGNLEEALEQLHRAFEIQEERAPSSLLDVAVLCNNAGKVLFEQGFLDEALEQLRHALKIQQEKAPNSLAIATSCSNVKSASWQQGKLEEALEQLHRALEI